MKKCPFHRAPFFGCERPELLGLQSQPREHRARKMTDATYVHVPSLSYCLQHEKVVGQLEYLSPSAHSSADFMMIAPSFEMLTMARVRSNPATSTALAIARILSYALSSGLMSSSSPNIATATSRTSS